MFVLMTWSRVSCLCARAPAITQCVIRKDLEAVLCVLSLYNIALFQIINSTHLFFYIFNLCACFLSMLILKDLHN